MTRSTMMDDYPLTLVPILERAGKLFGKVEVVSNLPDKTLHRYTYADFYRRARALAEALHRAGLKKGGSGSHADVEPLRPSRGLLWHSGVGRGAAYAQPAPASG